MPHRPDRGAPAATNASPMYSRLNGLSEEAAAHIMRPSSVGLYSHSSGVVTPLMSSKPWITTQHPGLRGMMPALEKPKSSDSTDRSIGTKPDEDCTVATLATESSSDELEKREATANALLLVSSAAVRHGHETTATLSGAPSEGTEKEDRDEGSSAVNVPLKKRKRHGDFLRRKSNENKAAHDTLHPCHESPVSRSSVEGRTVSHEESTPERPQRHGAETQRSPSYDLKDPPYPKEATQTLLNSSKVHNAEDISLPTQVIIPHFPTVLHQVLSDPEFAGSVVTWLPDGESWKVLRWDALRREVLPRYFSTLRDEDGSGCGTIDAFLWHLAAWGFEEVKDGSDVGAYRHDLFIRGAQKLSNKMRFAAISGDLVPKTVSPDRSRPGDRMMLQVPTLAKSDANLANPNKRPRYEEQSSAVPHGAARRPSPSPQNWSGYRAEDPYGDAKAWGHFYGEPNRMYPGAMYNDPRFGAHHLHQRPMSMGAIAPPGYSSPPPPPPPPQVRSGRGAMRVSGLTRSPPSSSPVNTPLARSSFPVSNRGKSRKAPVCRTPIPSAETNNTSPNETLSPLAPPVGLEEAQRIGNSVKGVAIAISRKTKRKLPLARNAEKEENAGATTFEAK